MATRPSGRRRYYSKRTGEVKTTGTAETRQGKRSAGTGWTGTQGKADWTSQEPNRNAPIQKLELRPEFRRKMLQQFVNSHKRKR